MLCGLALSSTVAIDHAHAVPITLQARSAIQIVTERAERGLYLRGRLLDDTGAPIASEMIRVDIKGLRLPPVRTDSEGRFEYFVRANHLVEVESLHGSEIPWKATFLGDPDYGPTSKAGNLDLRRTPTRLTLAIEPDEVTVDADWVMVRASLEAAQKPVAGAAIKLRVGTGSEQQGRTDGDGLVRFRLRPADLDALGEIPVRARFAGDHRRAVSEASDSFVVRRSSRITLRVGREGEAATGRYRFSGRLVDAHGPIPRATVAIVATQRKSEDSDPKATQPPPPPRAVAVATTDADGIFLTALPARSLFADSRGVMELRALYQPQQQSQAAAQSRPVVVPVPSPPGVPTRWYVAGILWVLAGLALAHIARNRLWRVVLDALAQWRVRREPEPEETPTIVDPPFVEAPAERTRPPRVDHVAGIVLDAHARTPVAYAQIRLTGDGNSYEARADAGGRFELGPVSPGSYSLGIGADRYIARSVSLAVPHEGFLDDATFSLVAIRRRIRDVYGNALERLEGRWAWGAQTPREAFDEARPAAEEVGATPQVKRLKELTERAWYTKPGASAADAEEAAELLSTVGDRRKTGGAG